MEKKAYDIKERTYNYALDVIRFLESLPKDYINFYHYSLKSANESKFWLSLLKDSGNGISERAQLLNKETQELANILASSILTMKGRKRV